MYEASFAVVYSRYRHTVTIVTDFLVAVVFIMEAVFDNISKLRLFEIVLEFGMCTMMSQTSATRTKLMIEHLSILNKVILL